VPIQALVSTAVHSRGTPAQPAYPAVHLESTTRATCESMVSGRVSRQEHGIEKVHPIILPYSHYCIIQTISNSTKPKSILIGRGRWGNKGRHKKITTLRQDLSLPLPKHEEYRQIDNKKAKIMIKSKVIPHERKWQAWKGYLLCPCDPHSLQISYITKWEREYAAGAGEKGRKQSHQSPSKKPTLCKYYTTRFLK